MLKSQEVHNGQNTPVLPPASPLDDAVPVPAPKSVASEPTPVPPSSVESAPVRPQKPLGWVEMEQQALRNTIPLPAQPGGTQAIPVQPVSSHSGTETVVNAGGTAEPTRKFEVKAEVVVAVEGAELQRATGIPAKRPKIKI